MFQFHDYGREGIDCFVFAYLTERFSQIGAVSILLFTQEIDFVVCAKYQFSIFS